MVHMITILNNLQAVVKDATSFIGELSNVNNWQQPQISCDLNINMIHAYRINILMKRIWVYQNHNWYSSKKVEGAQEVQGRSGVETENEISFV